MFLPNIFYKAALYLRTHPGLQNLVDMPEDHDYAEYLFGVLRSIGAVNNLAGNLLEELDRTIHILQDDMITQDRTESS